MDQSQRELRDPVCKASSSIPSVDFKHFGGPVVTISNIRPAKHGYNVYFKTKNVVRKTEEKYDGSQIDIADFLAADQSGSAQCRIVGEAAQGIREGEVYSLRNGRADVVKSRIRLSIDRFGKIFKEVSLFTPLLCLNCLKCLRIYSLLMLMLNECLCSYVYTLILMFL